MWGLEYKSKSNNIEFMYDAHIEIISFFRSYSVTAEKLLFKKEHLRFKNVILTFLRRENKS